MNRIRRLEKLGRRDEKTALARVVWLSVLTLALILFFFTFGISILGRFADFLDAIFTNNNQETTQKLPPQLPRLDDLPAATNSARLVVSGFASEGEKAAIYLNGEKIDEVSLADSEFIFENVLLHEGENLISVRAIDARGLESQMTDSKKVVFDKEEPKLTVESPTAGQSFSGNNRIKVSGTTDRDAQVFANGFLASLDFEGNFEVLVPVVEGETTIEIKAVDPAGNVKTEIRKVNFRK